MADPAALYPTSVGNKCCKSKTCREASSPIAPKPPGDDCCDQKKQSAGISDLVSRDMCGDNKVSLQGSSDTKRSGSDACCSGKQKPTCVRDGGGEASRSSGDGCCGPEKGLASEPKMQVEAANPKLSDCCSGHEASKCSSAKAPKACPETCCNGDEGPVCDENCIKVFAAYECKETCKNGLDSHGSTGEDLSDACSNHLRSAFERYSSLLESARCLCRSIQNSHIVRCCERKASFVKPNPANSTGCPTGHDASSCTRKTVCSRQKASKPTAQGRHCSDIDKITGTLKENKCCSKKGLAECSPATRTSKPVPEVSVFSQSADVEKGAAREHVLLSVAGMTCTGCDTKLTRALQAISGVSNTRVTFVTGAADFDLDPGGHSADDVIGLLEESTGFTFSRVSREDQSLDVLMNKTTAKALSGRLPVEVHGIEILDKKTARITYNPTVIGARELMASLGDSTSGLAAPAVDASLSRGEKRLYDTLVKVVLAACFTIPVVVLAWGHTSVSEHTKAYISISLATVVQLLAVPEFYQPAISSLIQSRVIELDMLVVISITAAYFYSVVAFGFFAAGKPLEVRGFFETSTLLITLVLLGRLVAAFARIRAVEAVSVRSLQAPTTLLISNGQSHEIDARLLQFGDQFQVASHTQIPTDGVVLEGRSEVDESMLTGESLPVGKLPGSKLIAGTLNGTGILRARVSRLPGKNTVTDIATQVEKAYTTKPKVQDLADIVSGYFIPVVLAVALIVFAVWIAVALRVRKQDDGSAVGTAITYAIAVLAISCPCAIGLAVPMVLVVAGGVAARGGVIIKTGVAIERGYKVTDVVFDKTGTLTMDNLDVVAEKLLGANHEQIKSLVLPLVEANKHPVSVAIAQYLQKMKIPKFFLDDIRVVPGAGVEARWNGLLIRAGNAYWTGVDMHPEVQRLIGQGTTTLCFTQDSKLLAVFGLKSTLRPEATAVIRELQQRKVQVHIVSGDAEPAVNSVAESIGIPLANVATRKSPGEKQLYVQSLMQQGRKVFFCGDGTNDAVAVAQADVGIQMGSSSDVTSATADVMLLSGLGGGCVFDRCFGGGDASCFLQFCLVWHLQCFRYLACRGGFRESADPSRLCWLGRDCKCPTGHFGGSHHVRFEEICVNLTDG